MSNFEQQKKEIEKSFDKEFYKNHSTRQWISRAGEGYDSEHPQMGRAEILKFISNLADKIRSAVLADLKERIEGMKMPELGWHDRPFYGTAAVRNRTRNYNAALDDVLKIVREETP